MTAEEKIVRMTKAINQAIKIMGDRFGRWWRRELRSPSRLFGATWGSGDEELKPFPSGVGSGVAMKYRMIQTRGEARADIFDYIERWHNPRQRRRRVFQEQGKNSQLNCP